MKHRCVPVLLSVLPALGLVACGGGSSDSTVLPANANGVLFEGDEGDPALGALRDMPPTAAAASTIVEGLMTTRLEVVVHPEATVGEANQALRDAGAAIVSMVADFPALTLVVPALGSVGEAEALAAQLEATDAFWMASVSREPRPLAPFATGAVGESAARRDIGAPERWLQDVATSPLDAIRMKAAQNAVRATRGEPVKVLVPDYYTDTIPMASVPVQRVLTGPGLVTDPVIGNRGSMACSIVAVDPQAGFDAVHTAPDGNVEIDSLLLGGLTWSERVNVIPRYFPSGTFVLNTGINYHGLEFGENGTRGSGWRVIDALRWRQTAGPVAPFFVHVASAGDTGEAQGPISEAAWMSPWALSEAYPSLSDLIDLLVIDPEDAETFAQLVASIGGEPGPLGNLRAVGSSDANGTRSPFSSTGADLRVVGENVTTDCRTVGGPCTEDGATITTTRAAAAQVAGLFAWMGSIAPALTPEQLLERVDRAWFNGATPGLVDAYYATLALDSSTSQPVRSALLDVAAGSAVFDPQGDGVFDEHDLLVFLFQFEAGNDRRFDLNGDGLVGGGGRSLFDLELDPLPELGVVEQLVEGAPHAYDEASVSDLEILCFYAYSGLYSGDEDERRVALAACHDGEEEVVALEKLEVLGGAFAQVNSTSSEQTFDAYEVEASDEQISANVPGGRGAAGVAAIPDIDADGVFHGLRATGFAETVLQTTGAASSRAFGESSLEASISCPVAVSAQLTFSYQATAAPGGPLNEYVQVFVELAGDETLLSREFFVPVDAASGSVSESFLLSPDLYDVDVDVIASSTVEFTEEAQDTMASVNWSFELTVSPEI